MTNPVQLKNSAPKILVIKLRHLGDILMAVPVFRALHDKFPYVHISALITKKTEKTLSENPLINELIVFDSEVKKLKPFQRYQKEISFLKK